MLLLVFFIPDLIGDPELDSGSKAGMTLNVNEKDEKGEQGEKIPHPNPFLIKERRPPFPSSLTRRRLGGGVKERGRKTK